MPSISERGNHVPLSPFRKLLPLADRAKAAGKHIYHLNIGQPDIPTPPHAIQALKNTDIKVLAYGPVAGLMSYRKKLTGYYAKYDIELGAENIHVTTGASEGILFMMLSCLNPGDEVIIPEPFYANYNGYAQIANIDIKPITCYIEDGFSLPDVADFEKQITPRTKAIFITNPNNPTGCYYPKQVLEGLAELAKKHDLYLFADEVYREFCYDGHVFHSILNIPGIEQHAIVIDSISKRYSACGARVGAIVSRNLEVLETISKYAKLRLSPPGLGQILAEATLDCEGDYIEEVRAEYDRRRQVVYRRLQEMEGVVSYLPLGAFYCFAKFPIDSAERFCRWLLEDFDYQGATVMLSPGEAFYSTPGLGINEARIAYILNTTDLEAAMDCLEQALLSYPGRTTESVQATSAVMG